MLRDRQVTVNTDQEPPCHVTEQALHKKVNYETITRDVASRAPPPRQGPPPRRPLSFCFVRFLFVHSLQLIHFLFLLHTLPPLVFINPCRGRTLQLKVTTVLPQLQFLVVQRPFPTDMPRRILVTRAQLPYRALRQPRVVRPPLRTILGDPLVDLQRNPGLALSRLGRLSSSRSSRNSDR